METYGVRVSRSSPNITHICLFVCFSVFFLLIHDTLIFGRASKQEIEVIKCILNKFALVSSHEINYDKSTIIFCKSIYKEIRGESFNLRKWNPIVNFLDYQQLFVSLKERSLAQLEIGFGHEEWVEGDAFITSRERALIKLVAHSTPHTH